jgi:hypothetical protein
MGGKSGVGAGARPAAEGMVSRDGGAVVMPVAVGGMEVEETSAGTTAAPLGGDDEGKAESSSGAAAGAFGVVAEGEEICAQSGDVAQITQKAVKRGLSGVILKRQCVSTTTYGCQ